VLDSAVLYTSGSCSPAWRALLVLARGTLGAFTSQTLLTSLSLTGYMATSVQRLLPCRGLENLAMRPTLPKW
jgi:hypothetical protein